MMHTIKSVEGATIWTTSAPHIKDALKSLVKSKGERATRFLDFSSMDYDLSFAALGDFDLSYCKFDGKNLNSAGFFRGILLGATFRGCSLVTASFSSCSISGASFVGADLTDAQFNFAHLADCDLTDAKIGPNELVRCFASATRYDGYSFYAVSLKNGGYSIRAGCRWKTPERYREHVETYYSHTTKGDETLAIIDYFDVRAAQLRILPVKAPESPRKRKTHRGVAAQL